MTRRQRRTSTENSSRSEAGSAVSRNRRPAGRCGLRRRLQRGNTIVEFALVSVFLIPLLLGTVNVGMNLSRSIQATQVSRDAGHMYARNVDFTDPANQNIIVRIALGLNMTRTSGNGKVTLSRIMYIGQDECDAGGLTQQQCINYNYPVFTQQIIFGNSSLGGSNFGVVPSGLLDASAEIAAEDYLTDSRVRANGFNNLLALTSGEIAYVSEAFFIAPDFDFPGFFDSTSTYSRTIF